ncbi:MAG: DUF1538 domain-containing protein [Eubacteriales bacterium]|nr:DUF1538 domain-containing protein [Eubacteriales bacterium]
MNRLWNKLKESIFSVFPVAVIVAILQFTILPMPKGIALLFWSGAVIVILGLSFFGLGADIALMPMGQHIGSRLTKTKKLWVLLPVSFLLGMLLTAAEPDLHILADQVPSVPRIVLILYVSVGVGVSLVIALLRIIRQFHLPWLLMIFYALVFIAAAFLPESYIAVAFDSGGVTTGPVTVPFILALGVGLSSVLGGNRSHDESFGLIALCSVGPILSVMIMGFFYKNSEGAAAHPAVITDWLSVVRIFIDGLLYYIESVGIALVPIILFFTVFQITVIHLKTQQLVKLGIGMIYTFVGLLLFLTGANVAFIPAAKYIGQTLGALPYNWILIPIGALLGFFIVASEPAVHILYNQIWDMTAGAISRRAMLMSLSIGVGISVALSITRILFDFSILYYLIPGYLIALALTRFCPPIFTAIGFDSGGVATGPITATFTLAFSLGACAAVGGNILTDAFGVIAMVAMTPLITIQSLGILYKEKLRFTEEEEQETLDLAGERAEEEFFEFMDVPSDGEGVEWSESLANVDVNEWVENIEWAEELETQRRLADLAADNHYIDLES